MAKKHGKNLQKLLAKKQQLQRLQESPSTVAEALPTPVVADRPAIAAAPELPALPVGDNKPVKRTLISVAIVAVILTVLTLTAQSNHYLGSFGDWLYETLKLGAN